jgi:hypothetical protein
MLERYALRSQEGFVVLDRQARPAQATLEPLPSWRGAGWRELPAEPLLLARIGIHEPGPALARAFRRPTAFEIQVRTHSGEVHGFRFLRSVGEVPFLLSPLVRTDADFASLFVPCAAGIGPPKVAALRILGDKGREVPFTLELQAVRNPPAFEASAREGVHAIACRLRLLAGIEALRTQPFVADGKAHGLNAHPPATFAFTRAVNAVKVCTALVREALRKGTPDGYALSLGRRGGARPVAQLRIAPEMVADGREACVEARFGRLVDDAELRVEPGGDDRWDWVYITRVEVDG